MVEELEEPRVVKGGTGESVTGLIIRGSSLVLSVCSDTFYKTAGTETVGVGRSSFGKLTG